MTNDDEPLQVAFERDTLDAATEAMMTLASAVGQTTIIIMATGEHRSLLDVNEVRDYLMKTSQHAYDASGQATAGSIRKVVYRTVGVVFEPLIQNELEHLLFDRERPQPVHVAQFWQRLG